MDTQLDAKPKPGRSANARARRPEHLVAVGVKPTRFEPHAFSLRESLLHALEIFAESRRNPADLCRSPPSTSFVGPTLSGHLWWSRSSSDNRWRIRGDLSAVSDERSAAQRGDEQLVHVPSSRLGSREIPELIEVNS